MLRTSEDLVETHVAALEVYWFADCPCVVRGCRAAEKKGLRDPKDPMLVDAKMIEKIRGEASAYVLCVPDETALAQDNEELLRIMASPVAASQIMGPKAHLQAAQTLQEICTDLMRK